MRSRILQQQQNEARKGGVFRALRSKGSLMLRNHYTRKPQNIPPEEDAFDGEIYVDEDSGQNHDHADYVDEGDPNLWTSKNWSIEVPLGQSITLKSRRDSPLPGSRPSSVLDSVPPGVILDTEFLSQKNQDVSVQPGDDSQVSSRMQGPERRPPSQLSGSGGSRPPSQHSVRVPSVSSPLQHMRLTDFDGDGEEFSSISPVKDPSFGTEDMVEEGELAQEIEGRVLPSHGDAGDIATVKGTKALP